MTIRRRTFMCISLTASGPCEWGGRRCNLSGMTGVCLAQSGETSVIMSNSTKRKFRNGCAPYLPIRRHLQLCKQRPDGQTREWWHRLKNAFGTASSAFVGASLQHLIAAARLPNSGISEIAVNASLAFIEGAKPRDEIECALVIQMACTHSAAMAVLNRLGGAAGDRTVAAMASAAARLLRAYATQVEALRRLRNGGSQTLRVEHVHVNEGGQALIGNVNSER